MKIINVDGTILKKAFIGATKFLEEHKEEINALNVFPVPDGDTGTNMALTMKSAIKQIEGLEEKSAGKVVSALSTGSLMGARGNSGVILSQLFRGFVEALKDKETVDAIDLSQALKLASDTAYKAVMKPTEGTILTVARGCAEHALIIAEKEDDLSVIMRSIIEYGNDVLNKTPEMLPVLKQAGVVDAGGKGLMCVLAGAYNAMAMDEVVMDTSDEGRIEMLSVAHHVDLGDIEYGYCTEFMINTEYTDHEGFRTNLSEFGDSLMVVGGEGLIKVHIHTNHPGKVLEKALTLGELNDIKIDNMRYQHEHRFEDEPQVNIEKSEGPAKKYSFITVSIGEGINRVFKELNVDYIIPGGQTMNPSTEDILKAVEGVDGQNIIILPNNSNIILAADQARELSDRNVYVFPSKTIPEGITALLYFDTELDIEENLANMEQAVGNVRTAQVTYAVRDTEMNGAEIKKDDIIGISAGDIIATGDDIQEVSFDLIKNIIDENSSLITIFYGNDIEEEQATELSERLHKEFEDLDVELVFGGQPLYYYIISIE